MLGFFIYISTLAYVPHYIYVFIILYVIIVKWKKITIFFIDFKQNRVIIANKNLLIIFAIILFSSINNLFFLDESKTLYPYYLLLIATFALAKTITKHHLKVIIFLIAFEVFVGIAEFALNTNTFFSGLTENSVQEGGLMYYRRVFGLSSNSSSFAYKMVVALVLIDFLKIKSIKIRFVQLLLLIGVVLSFNRTVLVTVLFYYGISVAVFYLFAVNEFLSNKLKLTSLLKTIFFSIFIIILLVVVAIKIQGLISQFTRDTGKIELAGRDLIWSNYLNFIREHFWFGNGSFKFYTIYGGKPVHAHNAYMQVWATNGIFISLLYYWLIFRNLRKDNWIFMSVFLVYSLTQYGIFWGISLADIILYMFMLRHRSEFIETKTEILHPNE
ncbi:MAG: O-antigen ligase family protein [Bacteroidales bacterium]|nr:O-antigen ligase family protein [Bacteroidales bacterium]